jgi:F0F1-type ATP synthase membrane subunit b/b'
MTIWWVAVIIVFLVCLGFGFIWIALQLSRIKNNYHRSSDILKQIDDAPEQDVEHIFNKEFREELRNRGRLHFEKIIGDNAMFLQQDLRLTTSQLNDFMKSEISKTLKEEFSKYEQSINDAKELAVNSIQKTLSALEEQRQSLSKQVNEQIEIEKQKLIDRFESNLTDIINHYLIEAIGDQIDLSDQMDYILADLENNKNEIIEDLKNGT